MDKLLMLALAVVVSTEPANRQATEPEPRTWTGWFSDQRCAREPKADEAVRPNGTECVKRCLLEGSPPVFLSEQANAIFAVLDHAAVRDDVGYRVEVVGRVDVAAGTIRITSVKRLSEVTALCLLPKKRGAQD
jgi:hypothetical protein